MTGAQTWLITGASRGIGLEFVRQLLDQPGVRVVAGARSPNGGALADLEDKHVGRLLRVKLDVQDFGSLLVWPLDAGATSQRLVARSLL